MSSTPPAPARNVAQPGSSLTAENEGGTVQEPMEHLFGAFLSENCGVRGRPRLDWAWPSLLHYEGVRGNPRTPSSTF